MSYDSRGLFAHLGELLDVRPDASLARLAQLTGVHRNTLGNVVSAATGQSFTKWRKQRRLASAQNLLITQPLLSTKEVASRVGLSLTGLDHLFQSALGRTPGQVRSEGRLHDGAE
jgi:AraC-like DNA-binding protein